MKTPRIARIPALAAIPLIVAVAFVAGMWVDYLINNRDSMSPTQRKFNEIIDLIQDQYVDEVDVDSLLERTIPYLISNLDPHSVYIPRDEVETANSELESSFSGIGIQFQMQQDTLYVTDVISGGPAEKVGVHRGDRILTVDGTSIAGHNKDTKELYSLLRGPKGSKVTVEVKRAGARRPLKYIITRGDIPVKSLDAAYMADDHTGYIKLSKFAQNTYGEFISAMSDLSRRGATAFVLDLRSNGGGLMEPAVLIANEFLASGSPIIETRGRNRSDNVNVLADGTGSFKGQDLVVLIDEYSASASEIVAGALQDNDRALVIGRRSFGKGLVQAPVMLADSSIIRLTTQRYYTPSGRTIQKPYRPGQNDDYLNEIYQRYTSGEAFSADSVTLGTDLFYTLGHRPVYGGGGIMPDVFIPNDTTGYTSYYADVVNSGAFELFAREYADLNADLLKKVKTADELRRHLPGDETLLQAFVQYTANKKGIPARWYYIGRSQYAMLNRLKALIARELLGIEAFYEMYNAEDPAMREAMRQIEERHAAPPVTYVQSHGKKAPVTASTKAKKTPARKQ